MLAGAVLAGAVLAGAVVLGGVGSHAQVLAFSRTQAVNRILPGTAFGSRWVVQEVQEVQEVRLVPAAPVVRDVTASAVREL
ncbi:hypothetical protein GCM10027162_75280 [Streptomyces incanus]